MGYLDFVFQCSKCGNERPNLIKGKDHLFPQAPGKNHITGFCPECGKETKQIKKVVR